MIGLIVAIVCFCIAGVIIFMMFGVSQKIKEMKNWKSAKGTVIDNKQTWEQGDEASFLMQIIQYKYSVNGLEQKSTIKFHFHNTSGLNRFISKYKSGDSIDVLYNPYDIHESTLKKYDHSIDYEPIGFAILLLIIGVIALLCSI